MQLPKNGIQHVISITCLTNLKTLANMKNNVTYQVEDFIEAAYMVVQQTRQLVKVCKQWKRLPVNQRDTEMLFWEYFMQEYDIFDAQHNSLYDIGVANSVMKE